MEINCCRVCLRLPDKGNELVNLCDDGPSLSQAGFLYETAFELRIDLSTWECFPQFICNSCEEQIRLFLQLKLQAHTTMEQLQTQMKDYEEIIALVPEEDMYSQIEEETELMEESSHLVESDPLIEEAQSSTTAKTIVGYEDIYHEFVNGNSQRSVLTEPAAIEPHIPCVEVVTRNELGEEENTYFVLDEMYDQLREQQQFESNASEQHESNGSDNIANDVTLETTGQITLLKNQQVENKTNRMVRNDPTLACFACSKQFSNHNDMLAHRKYNHGNKYPCGECPKIFQSADALRVHARLHSKTPLFSCNLCGKTFNQKVHYKYHMNRHNNVRQFDCTHCGKSFLSKSDLTTHIRSHTGERPYFCELCGKDFLILQHLKMHLYSHTNKSFECETCKQKFTTPVTLRQHRLSVHALEPRFRCELCDKRFRRKHHLVAHYKVHVKAKTTPNSTNTSKRKSKKVYTDMGDLLLQYDDLQTDSIQEEIAIVDVDVEHETHMMVPPEIYN